MSYYVSLNVRTITYIWNKLTSKVPMTSRETCSRLILYSSMFVTLKRLIAFKQFCKNKNKKTVRYDIKMILLYDIIKKMCFITYYYMFAVRFTAAFHIKDKCVDWTFNIDRKKMQNKKLQIYRFPSWQKNDSRTVHFRNHPPTHICSRSLGSGRMLPDRNRM